jgi:citron Rho-interacting kinase
LDFEVRKVIGRGHFGEVQVVRERQTGDVYAMKTLRKSDTLSQQAVSIIQCSLMSCPHSFDCNDVKFFFTSSHFGIKEFGKEMLRIKLE